MIKVDNLSYSYPQKDLYNKVSFELKEGQHCAFIGRSGSGKSTLMDIIMNPEEFMFDGKLEIDPNCRIGYVSQFSKLDKTKEITVFEYIGEEYFKLQNEIASICNEMETFSDMDSLLGRYQQALDAFDAIGGNDFESDIKTKLNLANLLRHSDIKLSALSGGEFKLVQVIKEMLIRPDLIMMDEPDAFLDFENLNSLRKLVNAHKGTMLIITHNRYLLNQCFDKILHLENMKIQEFDGKYIDYNFSLLETKIELQELSLADDEEVLRNELLINKLRYISATRTDASKGRALNARVKIQERLEKSRTNAPFLDVAQPEICLEAENKMQESIALKVTNYCVSFDEPLLKNVNFEIGSADKVALIGPNGSGKTTLMRDIFNNDSTSIEINADVKLAYLSQAQGERLNESNTIIEEFFDAGFKSLQDIVFYLSSYGFDEEFIHQKIGPLSGGEKNLLQLAKVSYNKATMLLLDEPTSHLDTYSQVVLDHALAEYKGAILMISHDYYSIANCMDYVLMIEDKSIRKMNMKNFRRMVYSNYFDKNYLEIEQKKKSVEMEIELALKHDKIALAKVLSARLKKLAFYD
ncbi:MAG: ABC-F family ATP-binding cassette domain-containing protein [Clostridia bacterium]|nr:ABC-F family ATP-binding cassette domain-containing protein [Clostridia bacterium]